MTKEKHSHDYKYLHCALCLSERQEHGLTVFITKVGDLGIACTKHEEFRMVVKNSEVAASLLDIAIEPCGHEDCPINKKEAHH